MITGSSERIQIFRLNQYPVLTVCDHFRNAPDPTRDDGQPGSHRLRQDGWQCLSQRGKDEDITCRQHTWHILAHPGKDHAARYASVLYFLLQSVLVRSTPNDEIIGIWVGGQDTR